MKDSDLKINKIEDLIKKDLYKKYNVFKSKSFKFGGWSVEKDFAKFLGTLIKKFKFENIVELGSGVSTLILAKELKNKKVKIFSIDHFQGYQNKVCEELERCNFNYINFRTIKIRITYLLGKFFFLILKNFKKK